MFNMLKCNMQASFQTIYIPSIFVVRAVCWDRSDVYCLLRGRNRNKCCVLLLLLQQLLLLLLFWLLLVLLLVLMLIPGQL
jgi:hypothetical protein